MVLFLLNLGLFLLFEETTPWSFLSRFFFRENYWQNMPILLLKHIQSVSIKYLKMEIMYGFKNILDDL